MDIILPIIISERCIYAFTSPLMVAIIIIPVFMCFYYIVCYVHSYWKFYAIISKIPGPKRHPLWGSMAKFWPNEDGIRNMENYIYQNPQVRIIHLSVGPFLHAIRFHYPEEIGELLCKKPSELPKNEMFYGILRQFIGDGLLISNGEKWQRRRKLLTAGFHYNVLIPYVSIFNDTVEIFINKCDRQLENGQDWIEIFGSITLLTLDNILRCACSYSSSCQNGQDDDEYISAIKINTELTRKQVLFLPYQIRPIFHLSPDGAKWRKNCRIVKKHAFKVIHQRKNYLLSNQNTLAEKQYKDFIDILLTTKDCAGNGLTDQDIVEEMTTFIFRGHDTTGSGISWALYLLAAHPQYQERCRKEIRNVLKDRESDRIEWEDLNQLNFLTMCIKESLRIYPPVPDIFRTNSEDFSINGYLIPKGTLLALGIGSMHRNPHIWENPDEFNPMRFDCDLPGGHPFAFAPFSGGYRNCIGQKFALNEQIITIARILHHYNFELLTKEVRRMPAIVLKPERDIKLKLSRVRY